MKPTVKDEPKWAQVMIRLRLITKRGAEVIMISSFFGLIAAWFLSGWQALYYWADYGNSESGWIIIWLVITAIVVGMFVGINETKGD